MQISLKYGLTILFLILITVIGGCSRQIETKEIYSPDRKLVLRIEIDESGGAPVADVTNLYVRLMTSSSAPGKLIFKGSAMSESGKD
jgi:hypothetical protein